MKTWIPAQVWFTRYDANRELTGADFAFMHLVRFALADFILPERHCGNCGTDISERPGNAIWCWRCADDFQREHQRTSTARRRAKQRLEAR